MGDDQRADSDARFSRASAHRLSQYLRYLGPEARSGGTVSSVELAQAVGVSAAQVRRDLGALGPLGQRGIGYDSVSLAAAIRHTLGIDRRWRAVIVGVGNLARALLRYRGFREQGFEIVGLFDADGTKVGQNVEGLAIESASTIAERLHDLNAELAVITVPSEHAQSVAEAVIGAGVRGVLNFAPVLLRLPPSVQVVNVDLAMQLEQLAYLVQLRHGGDPAAADPETVA